MQLPDVHRDPDVHIAPFATLPHDPLTHGVPAQSLSVKQVDAHDVAPPHLNGAHVTARPGWHAPWPLHVDPLNVFAIESHDPGPHTVAFGHFAQLPLPSHLPFSAHVVAAVMGQDGCDAGGVAPGATGEHVPL
jgi:hypothetical protein